MRNIIEKKRIQVMEKVDSTELSSALETFHPSIDILIQMEKESKKGFFFSCM